MRNTSQRVPLVPFAHFFYPPLLLAERERARRVPNPRCHKWLNVGQVQLGCALSVEGVGGVEGIVTAGSRLRLLSLSSTAETDWQVRNPSRLLCGKLDCRYQCIVAKKKLFGEKGQLVGVARVSLRSDSGSRYRHSGNGVES